MLTKKEIVWIIIAILIMGFIISLPKLSISSPYVFLISATIILTNVLSKKIASARYNIKIEHKIWKFQRYGIYERTKLKKLFPIGLILPFFISILSLGIIKIFTLLQFDAENLHKRRVLKKRGRHRYPEINDSDLAFTAAWGFWALLLLTIIAIIIKQPELAKYSIYYGIWNLLPISNLDGTKIFFGNLFTWVILAIIYLVSLAIISISSLI